MTFRLPITSQQNPWNFTWRTDDEFALSSGTAHWNRCFGTCYPHSHWYFTVKMEAAAGSSKTSACIFQIIRGPSSSTVLCTHAAVRTSHRAPHRQHVTYYSGSVIPNRGSAVPWGTADTS